MLVFPVSRAPVAQGIERPPPERKVAGSNPAGRINEIPDLALAGVAVIASNFGQYRHPAWYHNLRAHPDADVVVDGIHRRVRAVEADRERRMEIWQQGLRVYPGFGQYEKRASHRCISVFVLEPV